MKATNKKRFEQQRERKMRIEQARITAVYAKQRYRQQRTNEPISLLNAFGG